MELVKQGQATQMLLFNSCCHRVVSDTLHTWEKDSTVDDAGRQWLVGVAHFSEAALSVVVCFYVKPLWFYSWNTSSRNYFLSIFTDLVANKGAQRHCIYWYVGAGIRVLCSWAHRTSHGVRQLDLEYRLSISLWDDYCGNDDWYKQLTSTWAELDRRGNLGSDLKNQTT